MSKKISAVAMLLLILAFGVFIRERIYDRSAAKPFMPFTHVYAVHYYHAKLVAEGKAIPRLDTMVQHPEGVDTFRTLGVFMEYPVGWAYRIFKPAVPFDEFVRDFVRYAGVLPAVLVFLIAFRLTVRNTAGALLSAAFYVTAPAAVTRSVGLGFLKESFALPLIFLHVTLLAFVLDAGKSPKAKAVYNMVSGLALFTALASWHFTQFYFMAIILFFVWRVVLLGERGLFRIFALQSCFAVSAGLLVPYLRAERFLISLTMCTAYAILLTGAACLRAPEKKMPYRLAVFLAAAIVCMAVLGRFSKDATDYRHVYALGIDQLRFFGMKPSDPSLICRDSRTLWDISHRAPPAKEALLYFGPVAIAAFLPFIAAMEMVRRGLREVNGALGFLVYMAVIFSLLYLLINRLMVFAVFFISLWAGGLVTVSKAKVLRRLASAFIAILLLFQCGWVSNVVAYTGRPEYLIDVVSWIKENTAEKDVILAPPRQNPVFLAYAGRPCVLHGKIESQDIREKTYLWADALMERSEGPLYRLCEEWGVKYFIYPAGTYINEGLNTWRYIAGRTVLDKESIGFRLEALPPDFQMIEFEYGGENFSGTAFAEAPAPELQHFKLVYRNKLFNVYEIID